MQKTRTEHQKRRREIHNEIVEAFGTKYSWLGAQAAREMLMSVASWNIQKYSNPPFRYRTHIILAWKRGFLKSTMLKTMADLLGEKNASVIGKVSDAAMRGSVSGGNFAPPKPLKTPIVMSTEFGQTDFGDELLNLFLALLEEGHTNVALNKIASLPDNQKRSIEKEYSRQIQFGASNEFDLKTDFVFWGATYDPSKLQDDALRSRISVVSPVKPLDYRITMAADKNPSVKSQIDPSTIRDLRRLIKTEDEYPTDFSPPDNMYSQLNIEPRESRDMMSYMACRNWWGLETNPDIMRKYIKYLKKSRKVSIMTPEDRIFDLIFDSPKTYGELMKETGYSKRQIYQLMQNINAKRHNLSGKTKWVVWSGEGEAEKVEEEEEGSGFMDKYL